MSEWGSEEVRVGQDVAYLALHQHGDVDKHVVQLLDAALQTDDVFVSGLDFAQRLFGNARVHNLRKGGEERREKERGMVTLCFACLLSSLCCLWVSNFLDLGGTSTSPGESASMLAKKKKKKWGKVRIILNLTKPFSLHLSANLHGGALM